MASIVYAIPTWLLGVGIVVLLSAVSVGAFALVHQRYPTPVRALHNEIAGFIIAVIGVIFAVVLAFLAIAAWEGYESAEAVVSSEASSIGDLYIVARVYPAPLRSRVRDGLQRYVKRVIDEEWKLQAAGHGHSEAAARELETVFAAILDFEPQSIRQQVAHGAAITEMNHILDARRARLMAGEGGLEPVVWAVVLAGTALTIVFAFFFGAPNARVQAAMIALLASVIGLVVFLIVALDYPFRGTVSIKPTAYHAVAESFHRLE